MRNVTFTIAPGTSEDQQRRVLEQVERWPGVTKVGRLSATSQNDAVRRMCYLYFDDKAAPARVVERLRDIPEIESAQEPAQRDLIT